MPLSEFDIIERYFRSARPGRADVRIGVGDDAAVLAPPPGATIVTTLACLGADAPAAFAGDPALLGHQLAGTALNRLAARGAEPAWITLALSLPCPDEVWLESFARALREVAEPLGVELVGGDTTRGPLAATVVAHGTAPEPPSAPRARAGHGVYVSGMLGDAALAVRRQARRTPLTDPQWRALRRRLLERVPRVGLARRVGAHRAAAADASAGLRAALHALLPPGAGGADVALARLPLSPLVGAHLSRVEAWRAVVEVGGDLELCVALADEDAAACAGGEVDLVRIGEVGGAGEVRFLLDDGGELDVP